MQATSALLALQLGWGLWLFPSDFARLGWVTGSGCLVVLALLTCYSGFLFSRLYALTPGAVIFGDIGFKAAGALGRNIVYTIIYTMAATRCVILHQAAAESLSYTFPMDSIPTPWQSGAVILVAASILVQVRSLSELKWVFVVGTASQFVAIAIVLYDLISFPDPDAVYSAQAVTPHNILPSAVAFMDMVFAFGGQSGFVEIMHSMQRPSEFPKSVTVSTSLIGLIYFSIGTVGYWSRGESPSDIILFDLGHSPRIRFAAGCMLVQATSQYLVNLNLWCHNLLVLLARNSSDRAPGYSDKEDDDNAPAPNPQGDDSVTSVALQRIITKRPTNATRSPMPRSPAHNKNPPQPQFHQSHPPQPIPTAAGPQAQAAHHPRSSWFCISSFVVIYSYCISSAVPYFSSLVGLFTSSTFLICAYALPAWFTLRLMGSRLGLGERIAMLALIPTAFLLSMVGLWGSILSLIEDIEKGKPALPQQIILPEAELP